MTNLELERRVNCKGGKLLPGVAQNQDAFRNPLSTSRQFISGDVGGGLRSEPSSSIEVWRFDSLVVGQHVPIADAVEVETPHGAQTSSGWSRSDH